MTSPDKDHWTKYIFYRTFVLANLFSEMCKDQRFLVSVNDLIEKLPILYDKIVPPINIFQRENYLMWKNIPRENHIDLLTFLITENWRIKFNLQRSNKLEIINETLLKIIMQDYGWENIPDTVIDLAQKGYDQLRRRIYKVEDIFKYMLIVHSAATEKLMNDNYISKFKIPKNLNFARRYPFFSRRRLSSQYV